MHVSPSSFPIAPLDRSWAALISTHLFNFGAPRAKFLALGLGIVAACLVSQSAYAVSDTWDGSNSNVWSVNTNWLTDPTTVPSVGDTATFNGAGNGNATIDLGTGVTVGNIIFDTASAAAYTIGAGAVGSQTLTLGDTAAVTVNSTVVNNQLFNANLVLGTAIAGTTTITNSSTTNSLTFAGTVQGGTGGTAGAKTVNVTVASGSAVNFTNAISPGGASAINVINTGAGSTGTLTLSGALTSTLGTLRSTNGGFVVVDGQNVTVSSSSSYGASNNSGKFELKSGSVSFNGGMTTNSSVGDGSLFKISGGTFSAASITMHRTSNPGTTLPSSVTNASGFVVTGGTANVTGNVTIGASNSAATALVSGGSLTVGGQFTLGNTTNSRYSVLQVSGGSFTSTDAVNGLVLSAHTATANSSEFLVTGGTATVERISFGVAGSAANSIGAVVLNGADAALYVGSGGIVKTSANAYTSTINLTAGTLGAKDNWSSSLDMNLNGNGVTVKAADASDAAKDITLSGALSGIGSLAKTGTGTLTLAGLNSYIGVTDVNAGKLVVSGAVAGSTTYVNSGGTLGGTGSVADISLNPGGVIEAGTKTDDLGAASLVWNGQTGGAFAQMKFELSAVDNTSDKLTLSSGLIKGTDGSFVFDFQGGGAAGQSYTLLTFASQSGFVASDFAYTNLAAGLSGSFQLQSNSLVFTAVPEPASAMFLLGGTACLLGSRRIRRRSA